MRWLVLTLRAPPPGEEPLVADGLLRLGARALDRLGERLVAYLPPPPDVEAFIREAEEVLRSRSTLEDLWLSWHWHDRPVRRDLQARRITNRIVLLPPGADPEADDGDVVLRIAAGFTFGDGEHGSTRGCLRLLERYVGPGERVLDVGAGSGILSVAAALLGAGEVVALERDPIACETGRENAAANGVAGKIIVRRVEIGPGTMALRQGGPSQGIVANVGSHLLLPLLADLRRSLVSGGWLILSGISRQERRDILSGAEREGFLRLEEEWDDGWWTGGFRSLRGRGGRDRSQG